MKERIVYIDRLKGVAILLVVIGHFIQYNTIESKDNFLFNLIYSFHMPLFMLVSGYVAYLTIRFTIFQDYLAFLLKKGKSLLIPFFVWPLIVDNFFFTNKYAIDFLGQLTNLVNDPRKGLWFLWYLFFLTLLYSIFLFFSNKFNNKNNILADLLIIGLLLGLCFVFKIFQATVYINSFIQYFGFYFAGTLLAKYKWFKEIILDVRFFTICLVVFALSVGYYSFNDSDFHTIGLSLLVRFLVAFVASFVVYYMVNVAEFYPWLDKFIIKWGTFSLVIYATHFKFIEIFQGLYIIPQISNFLLLLISVAFSIGIIEFCMLIYNMVKMSPILNLFLYGYTGKKYKIS
jgi:fucose 4-O-acetylase-like acetyltransferase